MQSVINQVIKEVKQASVLILVGVLSSTSLWAGSFSQESYNISQGEIPLWINNGAENRSEELVAARIEVLTDSIHDFWYANIPMSLHQYNMQGSEAQALYRVCSNTRQANNQSVAPGPLANRYLFALQSDSAWIIPPYGAFSLFAKDSNNSLQTIEVGIDSHCSFWGGIEESTLPEVPEIWSLRLSLYYRNAGEFADGFSYSDSSSAILHFGAINEEMTTEEVQASLQQNWDALLSADVHEGFEENPSNEEGVTEEATPYFLNGELHIPGGDVNGLSIRTSEGHELNFHTVYTQGELVLSFDEDLIPGSYLLQRVASATWIIKH